MKTALTTTLCAFFVLIIVGCSEETISSANKDLKRNAEIASREINRAEKKARPQLNRLQRGARVTAALKASAKLPKTIRVDVNEDRVRLVGTVSNTDQKQTAGRIARDILGDGVKIVNDISIER